MMPPPLRMCTGLTRPADAACRTYCEIYEVIRYVAALLLRLFEFSVISCFFVRSDQIFRLFVNSK